MPIGFTRLRAHREDVVPDQNPEAPGVRASHDDPGFTRAPAPASGAGDVAIARHYLDQLIAGDSSVAVRGLRAAATPGAQPDLAVTHTETFELPGDREVRSVFFQQQVDSEIPVFGSHAFVEVDGRSGQPLRAGAELVSVAGVATQPTVGPDDARAALSHYLEVPEDRIASERAPTLVYFNTGPAEGLRLVWLFEEVPEAPVRTRTALADAARDGHGLGRSPRQRRFSFDYLVDAWDGRVHYHYSRAPLMNDVPAACAGKDDEGRPVREVMSARAAGGGFELRDSNAGLCTFDLAGGDVDLTEPDRPAHSPTDEWPDSAGAAVSAHINAGIVCGFYRSVLNRNGIDGRGMVIESVVNCTSMLDQTPGKPDEWRNALWFRKRMWYGRARDGEGYRSYARYLDVVAHELTHGVTESTSNLVYRDQSGALNESFSDIFGTIIKNFAAGLTESVDGWTWEIGPGLGEDGKPLRSMSDPGALGAPTHASQYEVLDHDEGGVHVWSSIHNLAAYKVLTARGADGGYVLSPREVARLYYYTLVHLDRLATFDKALSVLLDVARTYFANAARRETATQAITRAYGEVGITPDG